MMASKQPWSEAEIQTLREMAAAGKTDSEIGARLQRSQNSVQTARARHGILGGRLVRDGQMEQAEPAAAPSSAEERLTREGTADTETINSVSTRIRTLDDLLAATGVDLGIWEVERYIVNKWEVGAKIGPAGAERIVTEPLFQVKATIRRNKAACLLRDIGDRIIADIESRAPSFPRYAPVRATDDPHLLEFCAMDLHIGKLAWREEVGEDYDMTIAREVFMDALEDLIRKASGFPVDRILMPIGNDLLQIDNLAKTTTGGTPQDTDSRYAKMFQTAEQLMVYALDRLAQIAPVEGVIVPGNHDRQTAFTLGRVLDAWYRNTDRVTIDCSPRLRKYKRYGVNLIGYTHGSEEKAADLPLVMAQEVPDLWAETRHREFHVGHLHKSKETRFTAGDSFNGVRVRIIPALTASDQWHFSKGYVGEQRAAEAYLWSYANGYAGHFSSSVQPQRKAA